jgi:hypothetical protein
VQDLHRFGRVALFGLKEPSGRARPCALYIRDLMVCEIRCSRLKAWRSWAAPTAARGSPTALCTRYGPVIYRPHSYELRKRLATDWPQTGRDLAQPLRCCAPRCFADAAQVQGRDLFLVRCSDLSASFPCPSPCAATLRFASLMPRRGRVKISCWSAAVILALFVS